METPYKQEGVFRFGSPSHGNDKANPETPDILKLLTPSLLVLSNKKEEVLSPVVGTSVFNIKCEDEKQVQCIPSEALNTSSRSRTRRRLLSDPLQKIQAEVAISTHGNNDVHLQRLHSNPMFSELSKILAEECLHMQTPTNLINVTWDASSLHNNRPRNVHISHLQLQKKFLQFRSEEKFQVPALEIESNYSKEVSKMEIDRYVELGLAMSQQHANLVHERFDSCRLQLINTVNRQLDELLKRNEQTKSRGRRGSCDSVSSHSEHQYDSGLSSDDSSAEFPIKHTQPNVDVLGLAMAAADVLPDDREVKHQNFNKDCDNEWTKLNFSKTFTDISSLLETFPILRQDVVHTQQPAQVHPDSNNQSKQRPSLKRKLDNSDSQSPPIDTFPKKARTDNAPTKSRQVTPECTRILTEWYDSHVQYPYPTEEDVEYLTGLTNLSSAQVKKWMANKRVRCFNTLSITGNKHPIKAKLAGKRKTSESGTTYKQLSDQSRQILSDWYDQHIDNPYPNETEKEQLAITAGITVSQVKSWFANRRSRASNRRRQVPNYFLEKFPEYTSHVHMVQVHRDQTRRRQRPQPTTTNYPVYF